MKLNLNVKQTFEEIMMDEKIVGRLIDNDAYDLLQAFTVDWACIAEG